MPARCSKPTSHSYYVVMIDYGKKGLEAVVQPERTRRAVVEMLMSGEAKQISFIHHVDNLLVEDVTLELLDEAERALRAVSFYHIADRLAANADHARDYRKHEDA